MHEIILGLKNLKRELRSGELKLISLVILITVICITTITFSTNSLRYALHEKSGELLGGDRLISSLYPLDENIYSLVKKNNLDSSKLVTFASMVINNKNENLALSSIKAVSENYPLVGNLRIADEPFKREYETDNIPATGTAWLSIRLMLQLELNVGDKISIGSKEFLVTKILTYEPDRLGIYSFAPRILINIKDVEATKVLYPGSRASYDLLLTGSPQDLENFENSLPLTIKSQVEIDTPRTARPAVKATIERGEEFLRLFAIVNILISGIAIAICARRFSYKRSKNVAVIRTIGASRNQILSMYVITLLVLGTIVGFFGIILGFGLQVFLAKYFVNIFPHLKIKFSWIPVFLGFATSLLLLIGFSLPRIIELCNVKPVGIFRKEIFKSNILINISYLCSWIAILILIYLIILDLNLLIVIVVGSIGILGAIYLLSQLIFEKLKQFTNYFPFIIRFGITNLFRDKENSIIQILSFAIVISMVLVIYFVRLDLLNTWQAELPKDTPNFFATNIVDFELENFEKFLVNNSIKYSKIYPIVRGRLVKINDKKISYEFVEDEESNLKEENSTKKSQINSPRQGIHRPLNLTWMKDMQSGNKIIAGRWFNQSSTVNNEISIEKNLADRLDVWLNDSLTFRIGASEVTATITSIREADWESFKPNFYVIYPEGVINSFPHTYINSFYIPKEDLEVLNNLIKEFSSVNIIDASIIINQIKEILSIVTNVISFLWFFTLILGVLLFYAIMLSGIEDRIYQLKIMRILGANNKQMVSSVISEYFVLGVSSSILAIILSQSLVYYLSTYIFNLSYSFNFIFISFITLLVITLTIFLGLTGTLKNKY